MPMARAGMSRSNGHAVSCLVHESMLPRRRGASEILTVGGIRHLALRLNCVQAHGERL